MLVRPKEGILDPQGDAVRQSLRNLGFDVAERSRRPGRRSRADCRRRRATRREQLERMCAELLANPLIESVEIRLDE